MDQVQQNAHLYGSLLCAKETYLYGKRGLQNTWKTQRPTNAQAYLRYARVPKETYLYGKRDLFIWQKRPIHMAKETYSYGKRGLLTLAYLRDWRQSWHYPVSFAIQIGLFCHTNRSLLTLKHTWGTPFPGPRGFVRRRGGPGVCPALVCAWGRPALPWALAPPV